MPLLLLSAISWAARRAANVIRSSLGFDHPDSSTAHQTKGVPCDVAPPDYCPTNGQFDPTLFSYTKLRSLTHSTTKGLELVSENQGNKTENTHTESEKSILSGVCTKLSYFSSLPRAAALSVGRAIIYITRTTINNSCRAVVAMFNMLLATIRRSFSWFWERIAALISRIRMAAKQLVATKVAFTSRGSKIVIPLFMVITFTPIAIFHAILKTLVKLILTNLKNEQEKNEKCEILISMACNKRANNESVGCWIFKDKNLIFRCIKPQYHQAKSLNSLDWYHIEGRLVEVACVKDRKKCQGVSYKFL